MTKRDFIAPEERLLNIGKKYEVHKIQRQK